MVLARTLILLILAPQEVLGMVEINSGETLFDLVVPIGMLERPRLLAPFT
jgi:hypothetical protein